MNEWMNERMNEWFELRIIRFNSWIEEGGLGVLLIRLSFREISLGCEWTNGWMNEWMNEWMNDWMTQWMNEWIRKKIYINNQ